MVYLLIYLFIYLFPKMKEGVLTSAYSQISKMHEILLCTICTFFTLRSISNNIYNYIYNTYLYLASYIHIYIYMRIHPYIYHYIHHYNLLSIAPTLLLANNLFSVRHAIIAAPTPEPSSA